MECTISCSSPTPQLPACLRAPRCLHPRCLTHPLACHACLAPRRVTVLGSKGEGDAVNIEVEAQTQAIVDTVERVLQRYMEAGQLPQALAR